MLRIVALSLLAAVVLAQRPNDPDNVIDNIHGFRVEYDDANNLILFVNTTDCFIIEAADSGWDQIVQNIEDLHMVTDEIYFQIEAERGITSLTEEEAAALYDSRLEQWQCRHKDVHRVRYFPATTE